MDNNVTEKVMIPADLQNILYGIVNELFYKSYQGTVSAEIKLDLFTELDLVFNHLEGRYSLMPYVIWLLMCERIGSKARNCTVGCTPGKINWICME